MLSLHTADLLQVTTELFPLLIKAPGEGLPVITKRAKQAPLKRSIISKYQEHV